MLRLAATPGAKVEAEKAGEVQAGPWQVTRWKLRVAGAWTIPAVEIGGGKEVALVIADAGRCRKCR